MYCRVCGKEVAENAVACMSCGCDPRKGDRFCPNCGAEVNAAQVVCVKCGVALKGLAINGGVDGKKDKTVAGLLAIFLGALGAHEFYLGNITSAIIRLAVTLLTFGYGGLVLNEKTFVMESLRSLPSSFQGIFKHALCITLLLDVVRLADFSEFGHQYFVGAPVLQRVLRNQIQPVLCDDLPLLFWIDLGVNLRCRQFGMPKMLLDYEHARPIVHKMSGLGVSQHMRMNVIRKLWHCRLGKSSVFVQDVRDTDAGEFASLMVGEEIVISGFSCSRDIGRDHAYRSIDKFHRGGFIAFPSNSDDSGSRKPDVTDFHIAKFLDTQSTIIHETDHCQIA